MAKSIHQVARTKGLSFSSEAGGGGGGPKNTGGGVIQFWKEK